MLKKISSYINFLDQKIPYFPSTKSSKPFSVNMVFHDRRKYHLIAFLRTERSSFSVLKISCKVNTKER